MENSAHLNCMHCFPLLLQPPEMSSLGRGGSISSAMTTGAVTAPARPIPVEQPSMRVPPPMAPMAPVPPSYPNQQGEWGGITCRMEGRESIMVQQASQTDCLTHLTMTHNDSLGRPSIETCCQAYIQFCSLLLLPPPNPW